MGRTKVLKIETLEGTAYRITYKHFTRGIKTRKFSGKSVR